MEFVPYTILYHGNNEHYLIEKELLNKYLLLKQETIPFLKDKMLKVLYS